MVKAKDDDLPAEMGIQGKGGQWLTVPPEPGCTVGTRGDEGLGDTVPPAAGLD